MTTYTQFCAKAKMRHDYADMIQVRYTQVNGEDFDTWISGEEVMSRLKTMSREALIYSFSKMKWTEAKMAVEREWQQGKERTYWDMRQRGGDIFADYFGGHIFGEMMADNIRGEDNSVAPQDKEKALWHGRLSDPAFRAVALELAWINLDGSFPDEPAVEEADDWV